MEILNKFLNFKVSNNTRLSYFLKGIIVILGGVLIFLYIFIYFMGIFKIWYE